MIIYSFVKRTQFFNELKIENEHFRPNIHKVMDSWAICRTHLLANFS